MSQSRRKFLISGALLTVGALSAEQSNAQAAPLSPTDPQATALGYVPDTTKANQAKYPAHTPAQMCGNCQLYGGKATDATAPCPIYGGKLVVSKGWCSAYSKKAA